MFYVYEEKTEDRDNLVSGVVTRKMKVGVKQENKLGLSIHTKMKFNNSNIQQWESFGLSCK